MQSNIPSSRRFRQDPKESVFYNDPYRLYAKLHDIGGPVFWEDYGFWCLTGFESVSSALRDSRFARRPPSGTAAPVHPPHLKDFSAVERHSLLALEPPQHTRIRKSVNQAFVNRRVQEMAISIEQLANELIDQFDGQRNIDLLTEFATPLPVTVIARLLGVPESHKQDLLDWSHAMVRVYTMTQSKADEINANRAAAQFASLLQSLIAERRRTPKQDLLSHLVQPGPDTLSDDEIISTAVLLLNAGHEATVHQIGNAVFAILENNTPMDWLDDNDRGDNIIAEAMRFDAPLHLFTRIAQETVSLHSDVVIKKGEQIALLLGAANHDPARFNEPASFNPDRKDAGHVALGGGVHFCVGAMLAKLEMRIAINCLFRRIPGIALTERPRYRNSFHFHGLEELRVSCR